MALIKSKDWKISLGVDREAARPKRNLPLQLIDYVILGVFGCICAILMLAAVGLLTGVLVNVFTPAFLGYGLGITIFTCVAGLAAWLAYMFGMR